MTKKLLVWTTLDFSTTLVFILNHLHLLPLTSSFPRQTVTGIQILLSPERTKSRQGSLDECWDGPQSLSGGPSDGTGCRFCVCSGGCPSRRHCYCSCWSLKRLGRADGSSCTTIFRCGLSRVLAASQRLGGGWPAPRISSWSYPPAEWGTCRNNPAQWEGSFWTVRREFWIDQIRHLCLSGISWSCGRARGCGLCNPPGEQRMTVVEIV